MLIPKNPKLKGVGRTRGHRGLTPRKELTWGVGSAISHGTHRLNRALLRIV